MVRIVLPEALRDLAGGRAVVEVEAVVGVNHAGMDARSPDGSRERGEADARDGPGAVGRAVDPGAVDPGAVDPERGSLADGPHTVGAVLDTLRAEQPGVHDRLVTEQGRLRPHVNIFVDGENIRFTGGLGTAVKAGSEILVLPAISGG